MSIHASRFRELRLERLGRTFAGVAALRDVSLSIAQGEFIALLGPSGCGKSTTLNIIAGLLTATSGSILLDERRIDSLRPEQRGFGMVFQNYALFPHMNVAKNIGFGLAMRRIARDEIARRVSEAVALVHLQGQEHKLPGQLSGGQQQRVAIARAIIVEPPLVLMDEPLSNLDARLRLEMRAEIKRIHQTLGATTIYVTHDQEEALSLADRIVVLKDGVVRQVGPPDELYARPAHLDVAAFMGFRNVISGMMAGQDGETATITIAGGKQVSGQARGRLAMAQKAVMAVRPEDLTPSPDGPISAIVVSSEFRGREFVGFAISDEGAELAFVSDYPLTNGARVQLHADPARAVIFPEAL